MLVNRSLVSPQNLLPTGSSVCGFSPVPSHEISSLQGLACQQSARGVQLSQAKRAKKSAEATKLSDQRDNFAFARVEAPATASSVLILVSFSD